VPVFDMRIRFGLEPRPLHPDERFILVRTPDRRAALRVDETGWLVDVPLAALRRPPIPEGARHVAGTVALEDGLVVLHDVATFLSRAETETLDAALRERQDGSAAGARAS
jgi:chemotaxis signal transduction protein